MKNIAVKNLDRADKSRTFLDGSHRVAVILESVAIGKGEYKPGWQWSKHVGPMNGKSSEAHVGYIISDQMISKGTDGKETRVGPGDAFEVGPGHDAWVVGDKSCIALDFEHLK